jgi:hypothetical protein
MQPKRKHRRAVKQRRSKNNLAFYGGLGLLAAVVVGFLIFLVTRPPANANAAGSTSGTTGGSASGSTALVGEAVAVASREHVPTDTVPGPYASNPPAGGAHFPTDFTEKFYEESDLVGLPPHPEGYLVHSLEHGYVIFWYNCAAAGVDCAGLKKNIQDVMQAEGYTKMIAFPWPSLDVPLALTSWGRILKLSTTDAARMKLFVEHNRYQAPEPDAP